MYSKTFQTVFMEWFILGHKQNNQKETEENHLIPEYSFQKRNKIVIIFRYALIE